MTTVDETLTRVRESAVVWPRPDLATLVVLGRDRQDWLNGLVTCDLAKRKAGDGAYGLCVTKQGKLSAELWLVLVEDRIVAGTAKGGLAALASTLDRHLIMEDAELDTSSPERWLFAVGAEAPRLLDVARDAGAQAALTRRQDIPVLVAVTSPTDEERVRACLEDALGGVPALTREAWEGARVALGIPALGVDFGEEHYPQEASLELDGVAFDKGCYLGQEAVFMLQHRGHVKRRLVQLEGRASVPGVVSSAGPLRPGADVTTSDGVTVGHVSSAVAGVDGDRWFALAMVKYKQAVAGTELHVGDLVGTVTPRLAVVAD